ncbi:MAG: hypothetical protein COZ07_00890 [Candidatus Infernicultor aquiphilus]|uniref:Uncharacterized protein n=1 Tax=Candidatus Infernicultor aquiphilus TaxID=1805029 RepID=A0A2M7PT17_9BACT|nr:hypothetical protein [Caldisericota bacterium]PIW11404.1 MAG: hypothetical protein COW35_07235 [Candidatus Atribacteria bacterium CG17_big_fil_post_rev_8_21_14_2_50_34_11]PIY33783.1 MAG: hypothetical protein COZ07_00890 [Candidatus Atribacteria bacterium CG_4_10_14_3_um_filter_34_13]
MKRLLYFLKKSFDVFDKAMKEDSTSFIRKQLEEEENIFALITMGIFSGIPSPPTGIVLRILPHMSREISIMIKRSANLDDVFGEIMGTFNVD